MPPKPALESHGEQRATVLYKLAPEFKLMWAPLWLRALVHCTRRRGAGCARGNPSAACVARLRLLTSQVDSRLS